MDYNIPDKHELEHRLGETYKLDGSFASLWAIEALLMTIRKKKEWMSLCSWIPDYIATILDRALQEMNAKKIDRPDLNKDIKLLLDPPTNFPSPTGEPWLKVPVFHLAATPWYVLGVLFKSQKQDDVLNWLAKEYFKTEIHQTDELQDLSYKIIKAMYWPLLSAQNNLFADINLENLKTIYTNESKIDDFINVILKLLVSQDRIVSVLAGASCFLINICPTSPLEARCLKRCLQYFKTLPDAIGGESHDRTLEIVKMLSSSNESTIKGMDESQYLESIKLANQNKPEQACEILTSLIGKHPHNALYIRTRGRLMEKMGKDQYAIDDYSLAVRTNPNYWQALVNRAAFYAKRKNYKLANSDYLAALHIRPDCEQTRDNLLTAYFLGQNHSHVS